MPRTTQEVYEHHLDALMRNDLPALMEDYAEDSVLVTLDGLFTGLAEIRAFLAGTRGPLTNVTMETIGQRIHGDYVLVAWQARFDGGSIPHAADTFVIRDDRIRLQTDWFPVVPA